MGRSHHPRPYRIARKDDGPKLSGPCRTLTDEERAAYERELLGRDAPLPGTDAEADETIRLLRSGEDDAP